MGGERGSTTRQRLAGTICCNCKALLGKPHKPGERYCYRCKLQKVYMSFCLRNGWAVQFNELDLKTPIGPIRVFGDPAKIKEIIDRTSTPLNLETRNMIDHAINKGRVGCTCN
jgi:hypothetical protein